MTPVQAVAVLNVMLELDPEAIRELFSFRVETNNVAEIIVGHDGKTSVLGLLNTLLCPGSERIEGVFDTETHKLLSFKVGYNYAEL